ncbi:MAG: DNA helicase UvrD [Chloroflexi bacterium]|nr:DNA helicase UvrD [Chloroflexota bacterium]MYD47209.1 DNA helicase UvrD [Chloroflexota bacterium]
MNQSPAALASFVADLHIHSPYAFACSKALTLDNLAAWAKRKGIDLLSTGDFTHPAWAAKLRANLVLGSDGLYQYGGVRFVPGTEISCVYRQAGRVRRIHVLVLMPTLDVAEDFTRRLSRYGNLSSDGRPTVSLSARDLLALALDCHPQAQVIPAHAWTPWYGMYGSRSGFDSLEECFGDLSPQVTAVETGLSSDPAMNRAVPELDTRSIVSFSDAHSLGRLGRELTAFSGELSWDGLVYGLCRSGVAFTVEFYPEEGKYHYSGHRTCGVVYGPTEEAANGTDCPVCGRPLTLGVLHRVSRLASRPLLDDLQPDASGLIDSGGLHPPFARLIPLQEVIAAVRGVGVNSRRVMREYDAVLDHMGSELAALLYASSADLLPVAGETLTEAIMRARTGEVTVEPGYDGVYGTIKPVPDSLPAGQPSLL